MQGQRQMIDYQQGKQLEMWKATGPVGQMEQYKAAGLNPGLMYGIGGGGGQTVGSANANVSGGDAPKGGNEIQGMALMMQQAQLNAAQIENVKANTQKTLTEAANIGKGGVDYEKTALGNIILKYAGKEAEAQWLINDELRASEYGAKANELAARSATAEQLAKLAEEGKIYAKTNEEIEALILSNAKSREEKKNIMKQFDILEENLKGAKLSNIILELEKDLQTKTGLDKTSQGWMKVLGRLFIGLTNQ